MRFRVVAAAAITALTATVGGCAPIADDSVSIADSPPQKRSPYRGSLTPPPSAGPEAPGAAGRVVRCSAPPRGGSESSPYTEGAVAKTADHAIDVAFSEGFFLDLVTRSLDRERADDDRVLYTTSYDGAAKQAVVVRHGPAGPGTGADSNGFGWYVESWAVCDLADFPDSVSSAKGVHVWSDRTGTRVATTTVVASSGPAHCGWQGMTFLSLDGGDVTNTTGESFVDRPNRDLVRYFDSPPVAHTTLPADAIDTGYHRGGRHLWLAADHAVAYVGSTDDVAAWPRVARPFGCA